eukprot:749606-Hanusia_phi.AAC.2
MSSFSAFAEQEDGSSSRASTPETLPEEAPAMHGVGEAASAAFDMTVNHCKLLILISKYAQCALTAEDNESWVRQVPLWVLIYEGIMKEERTGSCEWTEAFVGRLSVCDFISSQSSAGLTAAVSQTVPQVSLKGLQFLKTLPNSLFEEVNQFLYAPNAPVS